MTPTLIIRLPLRSALTNVADHARWNACDYSEARNIVCNNRAGANQRTFADRDAREYCCIAANARAFLNHSFNHLPVGFRLRRTIFVHRTRINVVGKHHPMADKTFILNDNALADEGVRRDLATLTDADVLLNLDKGADLRVRANRTAVEIDQVRLKNTDARTNDYVRCYRHVF